MPDEPLPEQQNLVARLNRAAKRTIDIKKDLIAARDAKSIKPSREMLDFLKDDATFTAVAIEAQKDGTGDPGSKYEPTMMHVHFSE